MCLADRPLVKPDVASEYAFPNSDFQRLCERLDSNNNYALKMGLDKDGTVASVPPNRCDALAESC